MPRATEVFQVGDRVRVVYEYSLNANKIGVVKKIDQSVWVQYEDGSLDKWGHAESLELVKSNNTFKVRWNPSEEKQPEWEVDVNKIYEAEAPVEFDWAYRVNGMLWSKRFWIKIDQEPVDEYLNELKEILSHEESETIYVDFDKNYVKDCVVPRFKMILEELK